MSLSKSAGIAPAIALFVCGFVCTCRAEILIKVAHNSNEDASPAWKFDSVPYPSKTDAAATALVTLVEGQPDANGAGLESLCDGRVPTSEDEPKANFFFRAGTDGGRLQLDLQRRVEIKRISSYSWHPGTRGPQVYRLYASNGEASGFNPKPSRDTTPQDCGWVPLANVDTRPKAGDAGGQYGVSISSSQGLLGTYRYLLFDTSKTEGEDPFGNTFYSEIDVVEAGVPDAPEPLAVVAPMRRQVIEANGGYRISVDTTETPELEEWANRKLVPMARDWYPRIVSMLPSEGYEAPRQVSVVFRKDMQGVAATGGSRISCAANWFKQNLDGEAVGAVFHELVHVVQHYGARRREAGTTRTPGWLVEGIADYLRWFRYEPDSRGAEITRRNIARARYDGNYRITANFLNWACESYDKDLVRKLNAAAREGRYREDLWKEATGRALKELGEEWRAAMEKKVSE